jgi:hypothetical protein
MLDGGDEIADKKTGTPKKAPRSRHAGIRLSDAERVDDLRVLFLGAIEVAAPEVLEKLRDAVLPEYVKAVEAADPPAGILLRSRWPPALRTAILKWATDVRLLDGSKPPDWILAQVETTLWFWTQLRDPLRRLSWGMSGGYSWVRRSESPFSVKLPETWYWEPAIESIESAKRRIMRDVDQMVGQRLAAIMETIKTLPRLPNKRGPDHFAWTVLHQIRGSRLGDIAKQSNVSHLTVKNAVMALKAGIGISLPKGRHRKIVSRGIGPKPPIK